MNKFFEKISKRLRIIISLFRFLWQNKMWWLIPVMIVLFLFFGLILLGQATPLGPFIYTIF
jgi:hypothetical protein